jgi:hypothetical protein
MNKKRKYTKGPAWHAAHSDKARRQRKVVKFARLVPVPKYQPGQRVWHVDNRPGDACGYRVVSVAPTQNGFEYKLQRWDGGYTRNCMEKEICAHDFAPTQVASMINTARNRDLQIGVLKDEAHEAEKKIASLKEALDLRKILMDYESKNANLRESLAAWQAYFINLTPKQVNDKMVQLQKDRDGMINASNSCISEANKLRQVNAKLVEVIALLTR